MSGFIKRLPFVVFAVIPGLVVLLGYFIPALTGFRDLLVKGAVVVAAFALLLGLYNIVRVHTEQIFRKRPGRYYSFTLILAMLATVMVSTLWPSGAPWLFNFVMAPLGASLAALVVFALILAAFRLLRTQRSAWAVLFLLVTAVALLGSAPLIGLEWMASIRDWIVHVPGMAGMRGLLLGVALGTIINAVRVFIVSERPYSES